MAGVVSVLLGLVLVPLLGFLPGYLVLQILPEDTWTGTREDASAYETLGLSVALSVSIIVVVGFALVHTIGLTTLTVALVYLLLVVGLGLKALPSQRMPWTEASPAPTGGSAHLSAILLAATLLFVVAGAALYDGSEPYSELAYANASQTPSQVQVQPGEELAWTLAVENHEGRSTTYTLETRLIPGDSEQANASLVDETVLEVDDGESASHEVVFEAPRQGTWKVETTLDANQTATTLEIHRWVEVLPK